jgi:hypothetical protein
VLCAASAAGSNTGGVDHAAGASAASSGTHPSAAASAAAAAAADGDGHGNGNDAAALLAEADASLAAASSDEPGPAFKDTLRMLEWGRLCQHLAKHSSTSLGKRLCLQLSVPLQEATSQRLLAETQ